MKKDQIISKHGSSPPISRKVTKENDKLLQENSLLYQCEELYSKCLEVRCHELAETKLKDVQCCYCHGRTTENQIFILHKAFKKSWKNAKNVYFCFADLEKSIKPKYGFDS